MLILACKLFALELDVTNIQYLCFRSIALIAARALNSFRLLNTVYVDK